MGLYPAELWFARGGRDRRLAKQLCSECPVLAQCTASAILEPLSKGVVAGMTPSQVRKLKKEFRHDDAA
jgi:predicted RecB family nuclease